LLNNVSFLSTGGGHGYSVSLGQLQGGIDLDLGTFSTIQVDSTAQTMTVGGSVLADQIASALQAAGMEIRRHHAHSILQQPG
jgi:FAD/FMN-containing dehydrogenase